MMHRTKPDSIVKEERYEKPLLNFNQVRKCCHLRLQHLQKDLLSTRLWRTPMQQSPRKGTVRDQFSRCDILLTSQKLVLLHIMSQSEIWLNGYITITFIHQQSAKLIWIPLQPNPPPLPPF